jgi:hypothetical protein
LGVRTSVTPTIRPVDQVDPGVAGNARLTGAAGAVIFVVLAVEGVTVLRVHSMLTLHIFVGMVLVPVAVLKTLSTGYRFVRYYRGDETYVRKGAPPMALRIIGPFVAVLTLVVLGTGIAAASVGPGTWLMQAHKASFILWFGATTVHVLGHILETPALAVADWRPSTRRVAPGAPLRLWLLLGALVAGVVLALATRNLGDGWHQFGKFG